MGRRRQRRSDNALDRSTAHIAIIGSGLTGLATALQLEQHGFGNVTIYERDDCLSARREGYGLTLTYHPTGVLHTLNVLDELAEAECPSRSHYLLDSTGFIRGYFGNAFSKSCESSGWGQRGNLRVPRQRVRQILADKLQTTVICWSHKLVGMEEQQQHHQQEQHHEVAATDTSSSDNGDSGSNANRMLRLHFANGRSVVADIVIAADGIRSSVVQLWIPQAPPPQSLNVRIILGLTQEVPTQSPHHPSPHVFHQLLNEQGFYTLARHHRLFVMPYTGSALRRSLDATEPVRFMWQLSFWVPDENDDIATQNPRSTNSSNDAHSFCRHDDDGADLLDEARRRMRDWHDPVAYLLQCTPPSSVWGCLLYDRNPVAIQQHLQQQALPARVIVAGDALHAMSPFKGQGANQCLRDGIVIAKWLDAAATAAAPTAASNGHCDSSENTIPEAGGANAVASFTAPSKYKTTTPSCSLDAAVKGAMREMVQRTAPIVEASRIAARYWHLQASDETERYPFAGLVDGGTSSDTAHDDDNTPNDATTSSDGNDLRASCAEDATPKTDSVNVLLSELKRQSINAGSTPHLDDAIQSVMVQLGLMVDETSDGDDLETVAVVEPSFAQQALQAAAMGATNVLRRLSWDHPNWIRLVTGTLAEFSGGTKATEANDVSADKVPVVSVVESGLSTPTVESVGDDNGSSPSTTTTTTNRATTTCLHVAASRGHVATVHWLVTEAGCDIHAARDGEGRSVHDVSLPFPAVTQLLDRLSSTDPNIKSHSLPVKDATDSATQFSQCI